MPRGVQRSKGQMLTHRRTIAELLLEGWSYSEIAKKLGVDPKTVSNDVRALTDYWKEQALADIDKLKGVMLARLDFVQSRAWESFYLSQGIKDGVIPSTLLPGDPQFLNLVLRSIQAQSKVLGFETSGHGGDRDLFSPAQLKVLAESMAKDELNA